MATSQPRAVSASAMRALAKLRQCFFSASCTAATAPWALAASAGGNSHNTCANSSWSRTRIVPSVPIRVSIPRSSQLSAPSSRRAGRQMSAYERPVRPVDLKHVVPAVGVEGLDEHVAGFERDVGERPRRQRPACVQGDARAIVCDQLAVVADARLAVVVAFVDAHGCLVCDGVERVAQPVAEQVEAQHGNRNRCSGENRWPGICLNEPVGGSQDVAPR